MTWEARNGLHPLPYTGPGNTISRAAIGGQELFSDQQLAKLLFEAYCEDKVRQMNRQVNALMHRPLGNPTGFAFGSTTRRTVPPPMPTGPRERRVRRAPMSAKEFVTRHLSQH